MLGKLNGETNFTASSKNVSDFSDAVGFVNNLVTYFPSISIRFDGMFLFV